MPSEMEKGICGFCRRSDVEDVCGKLHMEKTAEGGWIAAHHRCMQYCALLVQYKFDHFGGFKIEKVLEEYNRGKLAKCYICTGGKSVAKGALKQARGATAGCAVKSCRRTFHYYCAKTSDACVTKRLVVHVKSKGERTVLYRVFCSKEHEMVYRQNLKKYLGTDRKGDKSDCQSDSEETGDQEDTDVLEGAALSESLSQDTNSTFIHLSDVDSPLPKRKMMSPPASKTEARKRSRVDSTESSSDEGSTEDSSMVEGVPDKKRQKTPLSESKQNGTRKSSRSEGRNSSNGNIVNTEATVHVNAAVSLRNSTEDTIHLKNQNLLAVANTGKSSDSPRSSPRRKTGNNLPELNHSDGDDKTKPASDSIQSEPVKSGDGDNKESSQTRNKGRKTCAVCIFGDSKCSTKQEEKMQELICNKFNIPHRYIFVWQCLDSPNIPKQNIVYFVKDLAKHFLEGDLSEVNRLLFDGAYLVRKDKTQYRIQGEFHQDLGDDFMAKTQDMVWSNIKSKFSDSREGCVLEDHGKHSLVLVLNDDGIDSEGQLRNKLGVSENEVSMVTWTPATVMTHAKNDEELRTLELETVLNWLTESCPVIAHVHVYPRDKLLTGENAKDSIVSKLHKSIKDSDDPNNSGSTVVFIKHLDTDVVNVTGYVRKVVRSVISDLERSHGLVVSLDVASLSGLSVHEQLREMFVDEHGSNLPITIRSAFDPSSIPISCVAIEIEHHQVQKLKLQRKLPCSQVSSISIHDKQTPSTSKQSSRAKRSSPRIAQTISKALTQSTMEESETSKHKSPNVTQTASHSVTKSTSKKTETVKQSPRLTLTFSRTATTTRPSSRVRRSSPRNSSTALTSTLKKSNHIMQSSTITTPSVSHTVTPAVMKESNHEHSSLGMSQSALPTVISSTLKESNHEHSSLGMSQSALPTVISSTLKESNHEHSSLGMSQSAYPQ